MINVYSIEEIIAASEAILTKQIVKKKSTLVETPRPYKINKSMELTINTKKKAAEQSIPKEINTIILEAENSRLQKNINKPQKQSDFRNDHILEDIKVTKEELVESMYLTFSKKIKKNTLKLIIDLREEIIFLTKNISSLRENKKIQNSNKKLLTEDITHLKNTEKELNNNLSQVKINLNALKETNKNLNNDHTLLKDKSIKKQEILTLLENKNSILVNDYRNKELESKSKIEKLEEEILTNNKHLHETNDQNSILVNDYRNKELESKSKIEKLEKEILTNNKHLHETNDQNSILVNDYRNKELESKSKIEKLEEEILTNDKLFEETNKIFQETNDQNDLIKSQICEINDYKHQIKHLNDKNQILEKTIEGLRLTMNGNSSVNITDLENKIKHYQDENIRISSELVESDKRFTVTKESLNALENQRSDLIEKLNSINHVIKGENIISNVFDEGKNVVDSNQKPIKKTVSGDLNKKISEIFSK